MEIPIIGFLYLFIFFTVIIYNSFFNNFFYKILFVNKKIIEELKKLALKAKKNDEVPISAIIAKKDKIIFSAYNTCHKSNNPLNHAEMLVFFALKSLIKSSIAFDSGTKSGFLAIDKIGKFGLDPIR